MKAMFIAALFTAGFAFSPLAAADGGGSWGEPDLTNTSWHRSCGNVTCTFYLDWDATVTINDKLNGAHAGSYAASATGVTGLLCTMIGTPLAGGACAISTAVGYKFTAETFSAAVNSSQCVSFKTARVGPPVAISYDYYRGEWCK